MFKAERQARILESLATAGTVQTLVLADEMGVSPMTVRRDLTELAAAGAARRVHGGATVRRSGNHVSRPPFQLGLVLPEGDEYFSALEAEILKYARALGFGACAERMPDLGIVTDTQLGALTKLRAGAVISAAPIEADLLAELDARGIPVVTVEAAGRGRLAGPCDSVRADHDVAVGLLLAHLAGLGVRSVGLAVRNGSLGALIRSGYQEACAEFGLLMTDVSPRPASSTSIQTEASQIVEQLDSSNVDAVILQSPVWAKDVATLLHRKANHRGAVIACCNGTGGEIDAWIVPPVQEVARLAVQLCAARARQRSVLRAPVRHIVLSSELRTRHDSGSKPPELIGARP